MAKVLNAYRLITASTIKTNADIPNQGDMTVVGTTVECVDITTTKVKNVIGAGVNTVGGLSVASGINHWSGFGPTKRTISGSGASGVIVNSDPTNNYKLGDFAGYNHTAMTPAWYNKSAAEADKWIVSGDNVTFIADIDIGEVRYAEDLAGVASIVGIALVAYEYGTSTVKAFGITDLDDCGTAANLTAVTTVGVTVQTRYDIKVFFVSSLTALDIVCQVPNISAGSCYAKIKQANTLTVNDGGFTITGAFKNETTGYCGFTDAYCATEYLDGISIDVTLYNWLDQVVGTVNLFSGVYNANVHLGALSGMPNGANIPSNGYRFVIDVTLPN